MRLLDNFYTVRGLHFAPAFAGQHSAIILRWTQVYLKSSPEPEYNQKDVIISGRQNIWNICPISRGLFQRSLDTPCPSYIVGMIADIWVMNTRVYIGVRCELHNTYVNLYSFFFASMYWKASCLLSFCWGRNSHIIYVAKIDKSTMYFVKVLKIMRT